jgi:WD40 repeat protein
VKTGREVHRFGGFDGTVHGAAFSPDGKRLFGASVDGTLRMWDTAGLTEVSRVEQLPPLYDIAISADGRYALTGAATGNVRL